MNSNTLSTSSEWSQVVPASKSCRTRSAVEGVDAVAAVLDTKLLSLICHRDNAIADFKLYSLAIILLYQEKVYMHIQKFLDNLNIQLLTTLRIWPLRPLHYNHSS